MTPAPYAFADGVTQSLLSDWLACRYRARLILNGWESKRPKTSFRFGNLVHAVLEHYYTGIRARAFTQAALDSLFGAARAYIQELTAANIRAASPTDSPEDIETEGAYTEALFEGYVRQWPQDWTREWIGVESGFDFHYGGHGRLRGKRDAVFVDCPKKGPRGVWLLETKTKSQINEDDLDLTLAFDFQSLFYLLALEQSPEGAALDYPIRGALYNIIRKPALRPLLPGKRRARAETQTAFIERTRADIAARPDHYFKRYEIVFPPATRDEFAQGLQAALHEFRAWAAGRLPTYRNPNACVGRFRCEFLEHCAGGGFAGYRQTRKLFQELAMPPNESTIPAAMEGRSQHARNPHRQTAESARPDPAKRIPTRA